MAERVTVVSRHFFRRRARARARQLNESYARGATTPKKLYRVGRAERGPFWWYVVKVERPWRASGEESE